LKGNPKLNQLKIMKAKMLKFKALGLFVVMAIGLFSCSDDSNDKSTSFLVKNGDTSWKIVDPTSGASIYAHINNNEANPFEIWASFAAETCYLYQSIDDSGAIEVLENTENKAVIRIDDSATEYTIITLSVSGTVLTVESEYFENGQSTEDEIFILQKTNDNVDDLEVCQL
jgi:hypothetical protein